MRIEFTLDREEPLDPQEVLGEIKLVSGNESIEQTNTYIDSWLFALAENLNRIEEEQDLAIDLVDERDPLEINPTGTGSRIKYGAQSITVSNTIRVRPALIDAARRLTNLLRDSPGYRDNPMLLALERLSR